MPHYPYVCVDQPLVSYQSLLAVRVLLAESLLEQRDSGFHCQLHNHLRLGAKSLGRRCVAPLHHWHAGRRKHPPGRSDYIWWDIKSMVTLKLRENDKMGREVKKDK